MTRQKWTTKDQEAWLTKRKPAFLEAKQNKTTAKEFFPLVVQEFRDKWPVPPVTQEEIADAGSLELAIRVKKDIYDKVQLSPITSESETNQIFQRISFWFHNNTRTVASGIGGARDILKVKPPPRARKLQPWQAYYALNYESQWKPHINAVWSEYKTAWTTEHPNEKPEKSRFQIMIEFMKQKFKEETEEMIKRCNEYQKPDDPVKSESAINASFQE